MQPTRESTTHFLLRGLKTICTKKKKKKSKQEAILAFWTSASAFLCVCCVMEEQPPVQLNQEVAGLISRATIICQLQARRRTVIAGFTVQLRCRLQLEWLGYLWQPLRVSRVPRDDLLKPLETVVDRWLIQCCRRKKQKGGMKKNVRIKTPLPPGITDIMDFIKQLILFLEPTMNQREAADSW